jgi:hypothetical protein
MGMTGREGIPPEEPDETIRRHYKRRISALLAKINHPLRMGSWVNPKLAQSLKADRGWADAPEDRIADHNGDNHQNRQAQTDALFPLS